MAAVRGWAEVRIEQKRRKKKRERERKLMDMDNSVVSAGGRWKGV